MRNWNRSREKVMEIGEIGEIREMGGEAIRKDRK